MHLDITNSRSWRTILLQTSTYWSETIVSEGNRDAMASRSRVVGAPLLINRKPQSVDGILLAVDD